MSAQLQAAKAALAKKVSDTGQVPLTWVATTNTFKLCNWGDALNPVIVSAISGLACARFNFNSNNERLAAVGTIGHNLHNGVVHMWGPGVDAKRDPLNPNATQYSRPPNTQFCIHALRGPYSRAVMTSQGIEAPEVYGDAGLFLPKIVSPRAKKKYELGVIVHISELQSPSVVATVKSEFTRYFGGEQHGVKLISTYHDATWDAFCDKTQEIMECKRIASTSFHGLIIPQAYGIPSVYFATGYEGAKKLRIKEDYAVIDHRIADFYAGANVDSIPSFGTLRSGTTRWQDLITYIDKNCPPIPVDQTAFLDAFPLPKTVSMKDKVWTMRDDLIKGLIW
jgi:pyruvyltransferase